MLGETFSFVRRNLLFFCLVVAMSCAIIVFSEYSGRTGGGSTQSFIALYLGYYVQSGILNGTGRGSPFNQGKMVGFGGYIWKNVLILVAAMGIGIGVPLALVGASFSREGLMFLCGALVAIAYPLLLALVGTWPTSGIVGSVSGLADAFGRGRRGVVPTFLRLFAGLVLPFIVTLVLITAAASVSSEVDTVFQDGQINLIALVLLVVSQCLGIFGICYASIVLARKFQISEASRFSKGEGHQGDAILATNEISDIFR